MGANSRRDASVENVNSIFSDHTGNIYFACNGCVRRMDAQTNIVTLAGTFSYWNEPTCVNGPGPTARFGSTAGGCISQGMLFITDWNNNRIRSITINAPPQNVPPANLQLNVYPGLQITGTVGRTYRIEASPDLTNWTSSATLLLDSSPYFWVDKNPANGNKYYRAVMLP